MIDVTNVNMIRFVQKVYEFSQPQGLGILHFQPGEITEKEAKSFIKDNGEIALDYVKGRACKMFVTKQNDGLFIRNSWYDHTDSQLFELLDSVGIKNIVKKQQHGGACNCSDCRKERGEGPYDIMKDFKQTNKSSFIVHKDAYSSPHKRMEYPMREDQRLAEPRDNDK